MQITTRPSYTPQQALADLARAEDQPQDAACDLAVISANQKPGESLQVATDSFIRLLNAAGNTQSEPVQVAYKQIGGRIRPEESRAEVTDSFVALLQAEQKNVDDATWGFSLVDAALKPGENRSQATDCLVKLIHLEGPDDPLRVHRQFRLIEGSLRPGDSRLEATEQYLRLREVETPSATAASYDLISRSRRDEEARGPVLESFLALRLADQHPVQASLDFQCVDTALWKGGTRTQLTREMLDLLSLNGPDQTDQARQQFLARHGITSL